MKSVLVQQSNHYESNRVCFVKQHHLVGFQPAKNNNTIIA
jgi:hypothetical protein